MVECVVCPFCKDDAFKLQLNEVWMFLCHSCQRYMSYDFAEGFSTNQSKKIEKSFTIADYSTLLTRANPINKLPSSHSAVKFCNERALPTDDLYYVDDFKLFLQGTAHEDKVTSTPKILIPLRSKHGLFGVQARTMTGETPKYVTIMFVDCASIYGLDKIDRSKPITVVEGPFDSMFVDNAIAVLGSEVSKIDFEGEFVYCFDNEPRSKNTVENIKKQLKLNNKVVIWPESIKQKDINEMVLAGVEVNSIIRNNTFQGPKGLIRLSSWKRV